MNRRLTLEDVEADARRRSAAYCPDVRASILEQATTMYHRHMAADMAGVISVYDVEIAAQRREDPNWLSREIYS